MIPRRRADHATHANAAIEDPTLRAAVDGYADPSCHRRPKAKSARRQGSAWHRRSADRAGHRIASRTQRATGQGAVARLRADACRGEMAEHHAWHGRGPIAFFAAVFVVRRTVRPLASIAGAIGRWPQARRIPRSRQPTSPTNRRHCPRGRVFRRTLVDADAAREAAVRGSPSSGWPRKAIEAVRRVGRRHLCHDAAGRAAECQSGAGSDHGLRHAGAVDRVHRRHDAEHLCACGRACGVSAPDAS